jgi:hypothetical protein
VHARREEGFGVVPGFSLHVLGQRERYGSAVRRIGQHGDRLGQRLHELLGARQTIPVPRHGPEAIVGRDRRIAEALHLLQDWIRLAIREGFTGQQQHRQAIDVRERRRGDHVRGTGSDRRRAGEQPAPARGLCVGDRCERHGLLVVRTESRQPVAHVLQRFAESRHVAVPEDREHTAEERQLAPADRDALREQVTHERLGHGEAHALHARISRHLAISLS